MKRRNFLDKVAVGGVSAATLTACQQAASQPADESSSLSDQPFIQWRMVASWPKDLDMIYGQAAKLCQRISEMTNGRFTITPYEAGELVGGLEILDAVQTGKAECGHTCSYYFVDQSPALAFATSVPFGLTSRQQFAWLYGGGGLEAMQEIYKGLGIMYFPASTVGANMGGWFRKRIDSLADLKGVNMRIAGLGAQVLSRLGVEAKVLSSDKIFEAMESGEIDAAEWTVPYDEEKLGLNRVAPYYYYPSWTEPGVIIDAVISLEAWNELPTYYQTVFKTAASEISLTSMSEYIALNSDSIDRITRSGTTVLETKKEIMDAAYKETFALYAELSKKDSTFKAVYEQWSEFREKVYRWDLINETSYANYAFNAV